MRAITYFFRHPAGRGGPLGWRATEHFPCRAFCRLDIALSNAKVCDSNMSLDGDTVKTERWRIRWAFSPSAAAAAFAILLSGFVPSAAHAQIGRIIDDIEAAGQARVIVRMRDSASATPWAQQTSVAAQREAVRQMRRQLEPQLTLKDVAVRKSYSSLPFLGVTVNREQLGQLMTLDGVAGVYPVVTERKAQATGTVKTVERPALTSSIPSIDVVEAWARGYDGEGYTVAVIDGGIADDHPMLAGKAVGDACFSATFGGDTFTKCPSGQSPEIADGAAANCPAGSTRCDHGTHVASIAVGNDGTNYGVARGAQFMPIDVFSEVTSDDVCDPDPAPCELTDSLAVLDALNYVNESVETYNIVSVNLSLGGGAYMGACDDDPRKDVIDMLREKGVATFAASGNEGMNGASNAPACISSANGVGATNDSTTVASFSNFASFIDVMAPGVNIRAAHPDGGLVFRSGTSMATPHAAGAYAIIRSALPDADLDEIDAAVAATGDPVSRSSQNFTVPRLKVHTAILRLQGVNVRTFNNVLGSLTDTVGQSYIRVYNEDEETGRIRVTLRDGASGARLGRWVSPDIPGHASFQFNVNRLETEAQADEVIASTDRPYYNLVIESGFDGTVQHVLWQRNAGILSNMTSCADGIDSGERVLLNVHSPSVTQYPSFVRIYNDGTIADQANIDVYDATTGEYAGMWTSPSIEVGASYEATVAEMIADLFIAPEPDPESDPEPDPESDAPAGSGENEDTPTNVSTDAGDDTSAGDAVPLVPVHLNIELAAGFDGYLQHAVYNTAADVLTDLSAKCDLGG